MKIGKETTRENKTCKFMGNCSGLLYICFHTPYKYYKRYGFFMFLKIVLEGCDELVQAPEDAPMGNALLASILFYVWCVRLELRRSAVSVLKLY